MWVLGPASAGCVILGKSLPPSGPQPPLLNDEGLDLVSSHLLTSFTSCQSLPNQRKTDR